MGLRPGEFVDKSPIRGGSLNEVMSRGFFLSNAKHRWSRATSMRLVETALMRSKGLCAILITGVIIAWAQPGEFTYTGRMNQARIFHTATLLEDGRVLVTGGFIDGSVFSSAEIYNPEKGEFVLIGDMHSPRYGHSAVRLLNGKVLITGGVPPGLPPAPAEIFDPTTDKFEKTGKPKFIRSGHTLTLLKNGKVLSAGGAIEEVTPIKTAELYDPNTGTFSTTGDMIEWRGGHTATLLKDGRVLFSGGMDTLEYPLETAELYDPNTGTFSLTGNMLHKRIYHTAILLPDGKVLIAGGLNQTEGILKSTELYDPNTGTFSPGPDMATPRFWHTATGPTKCGQILFAGGIGDTLSEKYLNSAEVYDSNTNTFIPTGKMNTPRALHSATMLLDERVLVISGMPDSSEILNTAELYEFKVGIQEKSRNRFQVRKVKLFILPNPFRRYTEIEFQVPKASYVSMKVYDCLGKLVYILIDGEKPEGTYYVRWDGKDLKGNRLKAGVYFCHLQMEGKVVIRKLVLL